MKLKKHLNRCLIATDALLNVASARKKKIESKTVLIIFQQIYGDAIVFSKALNAYLDLYPAHEGYQITFIARPAIISFLKATVPINEGLNIQPVDFKRLVDDYQYYREVIGKYRNYADTIIVPGTSMSAEVLSCACNARRKIGLVRCMPVKKPFIMALFYHLAYTEQVVPDKNDMMLQRHRSLLRYLGLKDYKATLPELIPKDRIIQEAHYIVCSPGSSKMEKCWPTDRFSRVIDTITENRGWKVHLCGGADEIAFEEKIMTQVKHPEMIVSHIGKTNFSDWSAIIQHADLVIGNDSATLHLAAAARVKAICIAGVYDKYQFFPYKVDEMRDIDRLPVTLYKDMPCEWCRTIGYDAGYGNEACKKCIQNNQCAMCIEAITVDEVVKEMDELLKGM